MNASAEALNDIDVSGLTPEWQRVELLCHYTVHARRGSELDAKGLERLRALQEQVNALRQKDGVWSQFGIGGLTDYEYDVLACVLAPEFEPRVGWLYQDLQPGINQPYPCPALMQELLALEPHHSGELYRVLSNDSPLRRWRLVNVSDHDVYKPVRPEAGVASHFRGYGVATPPPPGATEVNTQNARWDSLVLPSDRIAMLREFMLWIEQRQTVIGEWGGAVMGGPIALFGGPSGTGKTFAASVIAAELEWHLYRVDLGRLVSKYIGETEKNLNALFEGVEGRPIVLQFDEADSLFGKRGDIKEARDRYANMEVSHLLARIESHQGPVILTTNLRKHLDPAFARRFQMVIDFPRPDAEARAKLWQRLLPPGAPKLDEVDSVALGKAINLSGGNIRNIALHAAYLAAGDKKPISLKHISIAVWRELAKDGREYSRSDLRSLAQHLPKEVAC